MSERNDQPEVAAGTDHLWQARGDAQSIDDQRPHGQLPESRQCRLLCVNVRIFHRMPAPRSRLSSPPPGPSRGEGWKGPATRSVKHLSGPSVTNSSASSRTIVSPAPRRGAAAAAAAVGRSRLAGLERGALVDDMDAGHAAADGDAYGDQAADMARRGVEDGVGKQFRHHQGGIVCRR